MQPKRTLWTVISGLLIFGATLCGWAGESFSARYAAEGGAIVKRNGDLVGNRPLYCKHMPAVALAGDRPFTRLIHDRANGGALMLAFTRNGQGKWLQDFSQVTARFYPGRVAWELADEAFPQVKLTLEVVPLAERAGFAQQLTATGAQAGDEIVWVHGATKKPAPFNGDPNVSLLWTFDPLLNPKVGTKRFDPEDCRGDQVRVRGELFEITPPATTATLARYAFAGRCTVASALKVADASAWTTPTRLAQTAARELPIACGQFKLSEAAKPAVWAVVSFDEKSTDTAQFLREPEKLFEDGRARAEAYARQVVADTPDDALDVAVGFGAAALDGMFYPPTYVHGSMAWNLPLVGWRTLYGPTAYGWRENVKANGRHYIGHQRQDAGPDRPKRDDGQWQGTLQAQDSIYFSRGRIMQDHGMYNMQSVFFDMLIHAWRWTGDKELEKILRPALELHLDWARRCFDPDGNGVYESFINTWATDNVWYNGSETTQETAYVYRGHRAAAELARRAGDAKAARAHDQRADKILLNMMKSLWIPEKGYLAENREPLNLKRRRDDTCLYSIFIPIDSGMLTPMQAAQALYYTEWGLERVKSPLGGERCWTSNWVPSIWSVRENYPGDNCHLALAYFQTGLPEQGWELLKGLYREAAYNQPAPGSLGMPTGGLDFNDVTSIFCRTVVEGLFGYRPDRPNGVVRVAPSWPAAWDHASIRTPDFSLAFKREGESASYAFTQKDSARVEFRLPVRAERIMGVTLNGENVKYRIEPGFGHSLLVVNAPALTQAEVRVQWEKTLTTPTENRLEGVVAKAATLQVKNGKIVKLVDPTKALEKMRVKGGLAQGRFSRQAGHHMVFALVRSGELERWEMFKIKLNDPQGEAERAAQNPTQAPAEARWTLVDMQGKLNANVLDIYSQSYKSPRVETCSAQIAYDGLTPWTMYAFKNPKPGLDLSAVPQLVKDGQLITPQGARFAWSKDPKKNIAFTSQYDNWPRSVSVPVGRKGKAAWFLVAGSTNPMQTRLANGVLRLRYADGEEDRLELTPPINYWSLSSIYGADYNTERDGFCLPKPLPPTVQLGANCRAMVLGRRLREGKELKSVTLETLSQEVVIGLMGVSVME